jgi:hypothetical protein
VTGLPFTHADWSRVSEAARSLVNATFAEDAVLRESQFEELRGVLAELREKYGPHPVLLETEADFIDEPAEQVQMYEQAIHLAEAKGLISYSIRLSLARVLLEESGDARRAHCQLLACRAEMATHADTGDRKEWTELEAECARRIAGES